MSDWLAVWLLRAELPPRPGRRLSDYDARRIFSIRGLMWPPDPRASPTPWMDLYEAEDYLGLSRALLLRQIKRGKLPARDVGVKKKGGKWRVCRRDLDAMEGEFQTAQVSTAAAGVS